MVDELVEPLVGIVMLDDDELLTRFIGRSCTRHSEGRLRAFSCVSSIDFRTRLRMLSVGDLPLVMVCSDFSHEPPDGLDDLAFVADAPDDFSFAGIKANALPRTMLTAHGNAELRAEATARGIAFCTKPIAVTELVGLVSRAATTLSVQIKGDLREAPQADFIQGKAAWGPRAQIEASLARIEKYCAIGRAPNRSL